MIRHLSLLDRCELFEVIQWIILVYPSTIATKLPGVGGGGGGACVHSRVLVVLKEK